MHGFRDLIPFTLSSLLPLMNLPLAFESIRDIPYEIPLTPDAPDRCCSGKAKLLLSLFDDVGYEARVRMCEFRWSDVSLPVSVSEIPHDDLCSHVFVEVRIDGDWKVVDPTWDRGLSSVFPTVTWDGLSSTRVAVPATTFLSAEESQKRFDAEMSEEVITADLVKNGDFYRVLNAWLAEVRNKNP